MNESAAQDAYHQIVACLKDLAVHRLGIEILPSALCLPGPPVVVQDGHAIGIPKTLLIPAFKHASGILALGKYKQPDFKQFYASSVGKSPSEHSNFESNVSPETSVTQYVESTMAILLAAPEHITAANIRKRNLMAMFESAKKSDVDANSLLFVEDHFSSALQFELNYVDSLLTSPLHKHAKSPTLWSHRRWLITTFLSQVHALLRTREKQISSDTSLASSLLFEEFDIVSRAAMQHPRNYPAFDYLRRIISFSIEDYPSGPSSGLSQTLLAICQQSHELALRNPSDTSIWAFWQFIGNRPLVPDDKATSDVSTGTAVQDTLEMALRLRWRGEAVWSCLRSALATTRTMGMQETGRSTEVRALREWLARQIGTEDERDGVAARDVEELKLAVKKALMWIQKNWVNEQGSVGRE